MSEPFVKLLGSILSSTVWSEDDHTRIVWITMLAMADAKGYVGASVPGLAHQARVPVESARRALERFLAPDPDSRSQEHDGRRIEVVERGWRLLNYRKIRQAYEAEERLEKTREENRLRKQRERAAAKSLRSSSQLNHKEEEEEEEEREVDARARARTSVDGAATYADSAGPRATRPWPDVDGEPAGSSSVARALLIEALNLTPNGADELRPANRRHVAAMERLLADGEPPEEIKAVLHFAAESIRAGRTDPKWWGARMLEPGPWQRWRSDMARISGHAAPVPPETKCASEERDGEPPPDLRRVREILAPLTNRLGVPQPKEQPKEQPYDPDTYRPATSRREPARADPQDDLPDVE